MLRWSLSSSDRVNITMFILVRVIRLASITNTSKVLNFGRGGVDSWV